MRRKGAVEKPIEPVLGKLAIDRNERIAEYRRRKPRVLQARIQPEDLPAKTADGWIERKQVAGGKVLVEKPKALDEILENRFWSVLYHFGATELNATRAFKIPVTTGRDVVEKQIDVFAKIDDVVVVAECKASTNKRERSLQKDIGELASLKKPIADALRKHYGVKLKIIWLVVSSNIIWSTNDKARAIEQKISVVEERELRYFESIAKSIGPAAKYQFLGEFLSNQPVPSLQNTHIPAIRTKLGGQWAYYFVAPASRLLPIAFVNHRGLRDLDGAPAYQRVLKRSRLREIGEYIDGGGFFPNCITINFHVDVRFDKQSSVEDRQVSFGHLYLPDKFKSAWVIDGQHRLYGFTEANEEPQKHVIPVLAFERLATVKEAELFATINSKQQRVAPGLLDELAGELKMDSEDFSERNGAIAARALDMMSAETGNPFEDRIKTENQQATDITCLTISELKKGLIGSRLLGTEAKNGVITPGAFTRQSPEEMLHVVCDGLSAYFQLLAQANQERWDIGRPGHLCSNVAIAGHFRLIQALADHLRTTTSQEAYELEPGEFLDQIRSYLDPVLEFIRTATDEEFGRRFKQPFGSGGPPRYFGRLCQLVRDKHPSFHPQGLDQLLVEQNDENQERGDSLVKEIVDRVHGHVVATLKATYGPEAFFSQGIPFKELKKEALGRRVDDGDRMPVENYLDVIHLKRIVEAAQNWELFKDRLSIMQAGEKKGQAKYLKWMDELNEVRRISAHPFGRSYTDENIEFLEYMSEQLAERGVM